MALGLRSIGQVLAVLKPEFDDISISKIRFLEAEGLISPERAPSGYRRYAESDIERLRYILHVQKNHYLPLKVIREHLDMMDRGERPPTLTSASEPAAGEPSDQAEDLTPHPRPPRRAIRVTRRELLDVSGLSESALTELEKQQLVIPRRGTIYYGRDALTVAVVARKLAAFGMDARHLRVVKQAAEREVGLIEQAIAPHLRRNPAARALPAEVMQLVLHAHAAIMRSQLT